jgi:L-ribulose-5-phosphate 3-epimerase
MTLPILSKTLNRRSFVQWAGAACLSQAIKPLAAQSSPALPRSPWRLGTVVWVGEGQNVDDAIKNVHDLGLPTCQIGFEQLTPEVVKPLQAALAKYGVTASAFSQHGPGARIFNFDQGPLTVGIIPPATRKARIDALKLAADVARQCGIPSVHTHCGFIPEDPNDPLYPQAVAAVKEVGAYCRQQGRLFLCETGEETPITLLRLIQDTGLDNVFVNLDLANLILYGKGNPVDAMDVFGSYVRGIHAKDGLFPTNPKELGKEVPFGQGKVDFPKVFQQLKQINYTGAITIERETPAAQHNQDVLESKAFLEKLISTTYS